MASTKGQECSKSELLAILGTTDATLNAWLEEGLPVERRGGGGSEYVFNTKDAIRWLLTRAAESGRVPGAGNRKPVRDVGGGVVGGVESQAEAERRLAIAKANTAETDYMKNRGSLVSVAEACEAMETAFATVRAKMLALPAKLAAKLKAARTIQEVRALLDDGVREALEELAHVNPTGDDA